MFTFFTLIYLCAPRFLILNRVLLLFLDCRTDIDVCVIYINCYTIYYNLIFENCINRGHNFLLVFNHSIVLNIKMVPFSFLKFF